MPLSRRAVALSAGLATALCLPTATAAATTAATETTAATAAAHAGPDPQISRLRGSALMSYPPSAADEVRFTVDAYARHDEPGPAPTASWGTAHLSHYFAAVWYAIKVDCLMTANSHAAVTGKIVNASENGQSLLGTRIGFSVANHGSQDLVGFSGGKSPHKNDAKQLQKCTAPPPFFSTRKGGYKITSAMRW